MGILRALSRLRGIGLLLFLLLLPQLALTVGLVLINISLSELDSGWATSKHFEGYGNFLRDKKGKRVWVHNGTKHKMMDLSLSMCWAAAVVVETGLRTVGLKGVEYQSHQIKRGDCGL